MHFLAGTDSVHTTAAICDYLETRVSAGDTVTVAAAASRNDPETRRDRQEALNVAPVRLGGICVVETDLRVGDPAPTLLEIADEVDADELVVGAHAGDPDADRAVGSTATTVLEEATRPVVVAPIPEFEE